MGKVEHKTIVLIGIIIFLIAELVALDVAVEALLNHLSTLQYLAPTVIATNSTSAVTSYYFHTNLLNQLDVVGIGIVMFVFLYYFSRKPIALLEKMIRQVH